MANIPGDDVDEGEVMFDLLFPLVLPEGDGDHRQVQLHCDVIYSCAARDDIKRQTYMHVMTSIAASSSF